MTHLAEVAEELKVFISCQQIKIFCFLLYLRVRDLIFNMSEYYFK